MSISSPENSGVNFADLAKNKEIKAGEVLDSIVFKQDKDKTGEMHFKSSARDRKTIVLDKSKSILPVAGQEYRVKIIEDTEPLNPNAGKFIGIIVPEQAQIPAEEWQRVEERLNEAEIAQRMASGASSFLYGQTGIPYQESSKLPADEVLAKIKKTSKKKIASAALGRLREQQAEAESYLGDEGSPERILAKFRMQNLRKALQQEKWLSNIREALLAEKNDMLRDMEDPPNGAELEVLSDTERELLEIARQRNALIQSSPEAFIGIHLNELKEYKRELSDQPVVETGAEESGEPKEKTPKGRIVETPYVKKQAEEILGSIRTNTPVLLYGHQGSGKTELAMHIARKYIGKEALVLSGSKHTSLAELYGHQILTLDKLDQEKLEEFIKNVEQKYEEWLKENEDKLSEMASGTAENEKNRAHDRFLQTYLTQLKGGTISGFFLGPIYKAMEEGRPVIIDEVNAIPHEVLISLNHILTRKVGDVVNVQQDSGKKITIKEGFCIIMTGNLNQGQDKYVGRQEFDPAFLSRLHKVEHDYLPQKTEGDLESEAGPENELYQLLLAMVMDKNGNMEFPGGTGHELWNLAKAARVIQDVYAGREVGGQYYFKQGAERPVKYFLKESVLSLRELAKIISQWKGEGYTKELDYYIWNRFINSSTQLSDKAYLYQVLKDRFGFFQNAGWPETPDYGSGGEISNFKIEAPVNRVGYMEFIPSRKTVELAFGKIPERKVWPKTYSGKETAGTGEEFQVGHLKTKAGEGVEYYIMPFDSNGRILEPGEMFEGPGPEKIIHTYLGVNKENGEMVAVPHVVARAD